MASVRDAAHDLRGPLYRARVRIEESLQHEGLSEDARATMEATLAELERVQRTLGTLLQIAQAEGRGRDIPTEPVDLAALARELVELYRPEAATRDITLEYRGADAANTHGNSQLLAQVLVNLIENAIKYVRPSGRIDVSVAVEPDSPLHGLEGLKHMATSLVPPIYDPRGHDELVPVTTEDGWDMSERLAREEGLSVGHSSGANVFAAVKIAERLQAEVGRGCVVVIVADRADRYFAPLKWEKKYVW